MKEIAIARKYTDTDGAGSWDELDVDQTYAMLRAILVRTKDKMQRADTYGLDAEVIVMASIAEAPASTESPRRD